MWDKATKRVRRVAPNHRERIERIERAEARAEARAYGVVGVR